MAAHDRSGTAWLIHTHRLAETLSALSICAVFLLTSLAPIIPSTATDPTEIVNGQGNREIHWTYSDPSNYTLTNATVSGGRATLMWKNETLAENTQAAYDQGVVRQNVNTSQFPGSIVLGYVPARASNFVAQPAPVPAKDTYISQENQNTNYGSSAIILLDTQSNKAKRPLFYFDLSSIPSNASIINATLMLWIIGGQNPVLDFSVHALNHSYDEMAADWKTYSPGNQWAAVGGDFSTASYGPGHMTNTVGWQLFEISPLVDDWIKGKVQNNGLILLPVSTGSSLEKQMVSSDDAVHPTEWPMLKVNYSMPSGPGHYESKAIGPGTNSRFTSANWTGSVKSLATDEFDKSSLNPRWSWMRDPRSSGGAWDVNTAVPGWLWVSGSPNTYLAPSAFTPNILYQNITGYFTATTHLQDQFTVNSMGAGMAMVYDQKNWVAIVKLGSGNNGKIWATASENGANGGNAQVSWSGLSTAYLRIDRTPSGTFLNYSSDGINWNLLFTYTPEQAQPNQVMLGLSVHTACTSNAIVDFDYLRIEPFVDTTSMQLKIRLGNSTLPTDPSWSAWSAPLPSGDNAIAGSARYLQYSVSMTTQMDWFSPEFMGVAIHYGRYASDGMLETQEQVIPEFRNWISIWTSEDYVDELVSYEYSTDHGAHWTGLTNKYLNPVYSTSQFMTIRASMHTDDTLTTPQLNLINATYSIRPETFYIIAPERVEAGAPFQITVIAKDAMNNTIPWGGDIDLSARDSTGNSAASTELLLTTVPIGSTGVAILNGEQYFTAETISIMASSGGVVGLSSPIQFTPGPAATVTISPSISSMYENTSADFTASATDAYGNPNASTVFSWTVDGVLGALNTSSGPSVKLSVGAPHVTGDLTVIVPGAEQSMTIAVVSLSYPPVISPIPRQVRDEDSGYWTLSLVPYISDPDDPLASLRWHVTNESITTVQEGPGMLEVTFGTLLDLNGVEYLHLVVTDPAGMNANATIVVEIRPVNDAPSIDQIEPLVVHYGVPYTYVLTYYVHDVDSSISQLSLSVGPTSIPYVMISGLTITFLYPQSMNGTTQLVKVFVTDGELKDSTTIQVTVSDDQVPLVMNPLPDQTLDQGSSIIKAFDLDDYFTDPDRDVVIYTYGSFHVKVIIQINHTVDFLAPSDWYGVEHVTFRAADPRGARAEYTITVTVRAVNQPPVLANVPDLVVKFDEPYNFDIKPYVKDPDGDTEVRTITTDDMHIVVDGTVLQMLYPQAMNGMKLQVKITVLDFGLSDWWIINVTVSDDNPPILWRMMPDHSFVEDWPLDYPIGGYLEEFFTDPDSSFLTFYAFTTISNVTTSAEQVSGGWILSFATDSNYNGQSHVTIRAVDSEGAIAENTVKLTVTPVPDPPVLELPSMIIVTEGVNGTLDMSRMVTDPDSTLSDFDFVVGGPHSTTGEITIQNAILIFAFSKDFLSPGEKETVFTVNVTVYDETGLYDNTTMQIKVIRPAIVSISKPVSPWLVFGLIASSAVAMVGFGVALSRRKKPFVVHDMMLIHNDGFLISRYANQLAGEIDQDVLSGMLTAVLNFVEDSMSSSQGQLKTFGFKEYQVLVTRGQKTFAAVVYDGDAPEGVDNSLKEFLNKIERVYKKKLVDWSGERRG